MIDAVLDYVYEFCPNDSITERFVSNSLEEIKDKELVTIKEWVNSNHPIRRLYAHFHGEIEGFKRDHMFVKQLVRQYHDSLVER